MRKMYKLTTIDIYMKNMDIYNCLTLRKLYRTVRQRPQLCGALGRTSFLLAGISNESYVEGLGQKTFQ